MEKLITAAALLFVPSIAAIIFLVFVQAPEARAKQRFEAVRQCKIDAYDTDAYLLKLGARHWEIACIRSLPEDAPLDQVEKQCTRPHKEC
jgi:hypothetical protein